MSLWGDPIHPTQQLRVPWSGFLRPGVAHAEVQAVTRDWGHISAGGLDGGVQPWAGGPAAGPGCAQEPTGGPVKVQALTQRARLGLSCVPNQLPGWMVAVEPDRPWRGEDCAASSPMSQQKHSQRWAPPCPHKP